MRSEEKKGETHMTYYPIAVALTFELVDSRLAKPLPPCLEMNHIKIVVRSLRCIWFKRFLRIIMRRLEIQCSVLNYLVSDLSTFVHQTKVLLYSRPTCVTNTYLWSLLVSNSLINLHANIMVANMWKWQQICKIVINHFYSVL